MRCKTDSQSCGKNKIFLKKLFQSALEKKSEPFSTTAYLNHSNSIYHGYFDNPFKPSLKDLNSVGISIYK